MGHVFEDVDLIGRAFLSGRPMALYRDLLNQLAGDLLTEQDIAEITAGRQRLDASGVWIAVELKGCPETCDHSRRRAIPEDTSLQHSKFMTFNQCLRLDAPNCAGFFLVHMEHEDPLVSTWILINGSRTEVRELVLVLACRPDLAGITPYDGGLRQ